jgi:predicted ATPase
VGQCEPVRRAHDLPIHSSRAYGRPQKSITFFDRGIIDQVSGLKDLNLSIPAHLAAATEWLRYHEKIFMMPPWPEIFSSDDERKHSFEDALSSYERRSAATSALAIRSYSSQSSTFAREPISF